MSAKQRQVFWMTFMLVLLAACSGDSGTGPTDVKWDRDACDRCRMVLSDHLHAAQIRYFPEGKTRSRVAHFDDFGCASLWLEAQPWRDDPRTEFWVTEHRSGAWIDARQAVFVMGEHTPMAYGLGAQAEPLADGLTFEQARAQVAATEAQYNQHTQPLESIVAPQNAEEQPR